MAGSVRNPHVCTPRSSIARETGVVRLLAVGAETRRGRVLRSRHELVRRRHELAPPRAELHRGVTVLIKGSRVNRLERVATALAASGTTNHGGTH
jgi:UDP-N-acetylmuramyl pentapeptide synthase